MECMMPGGLAHAAAFTDSFINTVRRAANPADIGTILAAICSEIGFRYYALVHHDDLRAPSGTRVDIKDYPPAVTELLVARGSFRGDPVVRGALFADSAFLWSRLDKIISLSRKDRQRLIFGAHQGLNEGITVPCHLLGECSGSCTFAGIRDPQRAEQYLGLVQIVGIFAFQAARRLLPQHATVNAQPLRLYPRPRDCVILAGRGFSNKEIARALGLSPRTVSGYLAEACRIFDAGDRTELVIAAILAGEIGLHEVRRNST